MSERKLLSIDLSGGGTGSEPASGAAELNESVEASAIAELPGPDEAGSIDKKLLLNGLGCVNCAEKMEDQIRKLPEIKSARVDFVFKKLTFSAESSCDLESLMGQIKKIVKDIEPYVEVEEFDKNEYLGSAAQVKAASARVSQATMKKTVRYGIAGVLFAVALILDFPWEAEFAIFFSSYLLAGGEVVLQALKNITKGKVFDENFLMSVATIGAFAIGEYPEGVAVMLFYQAGMLLQNLAVERSRNSIVALMDIRSDYANLILGADTKKVSPAEVKKGDFIVVKPGEKVPLDGVVREGKSMVDTSALTGESVPREVEKGDDVLAGFINNNGLLTVEVKNEFAESTVSRILELVQDAAGRKAPTENFITKFAGIYTPIVTGAALLLAIVPPLVIPGAVFSDWLYRALVFLVISCPCALVVSIPLGFFGGIGGASRKGILVKGSNYLEALNEVETVVFDKTGTLTKGVFKVTQIKPQGNMTEEELLASAAYAESFSNHPIAISILKTYGSAIEEKDVKEYEELSGHGVKVKVKGQTIMAGNEKLMRQEGINCVNPDAAAGVVHVAVEGNYAGYIVISDEVKEDAAVALQALKGLGIKKLAMLTGDSKAVAEKIGGDLGVDEIYSELLPDQKVEKLEQLAAENSSRGKLVFVGDGINDAPVLARADVGVAMGGLGSDAAIEAADVVLMTDEPSKLVSAIKIAQRTRRIVWQNIIFALGIKIIVLTLGAMGWASMWAAVFADVGVALLAVLNALRVMNVKGL